MFIKFLKLKNFRNYNDVEIHFSKHKTLLIGKNAQGKTNILEAIYFLSGLQSLNAKNDSELVKWGQESTNIKATIKKDEFDTDLDIFICPKKKKVFKVNGIKKTKIADFIANLNVVCFSVSDLLLLRGTPDDRRNWLDSAICQIYPAYSERLTKYNKIKTQKNNYLKNIKSMQYSDESMIDIWNAQMINCGANIIYLRMKFLAEIQKLATIKHNQISGTEQFCLTYDTKLGYSYNPEKDVIPTIEIIAEQFEQKLEERKQEEIIRTQSLVGPHRDDISFFINNFEAKRYASQGQQRTIVLALKLAELELIEKHIGKSPILLLDDVLAELDDLRQNFLLASIKENSQTIITSVDTLHFKDEYLKDVDIFTISNNEIIQTRAI